MISKEKISRQASKNFNDNWDYELILEDIWETKKLENKAKHSN